MLRKDENIDVIEKIQNCWHEMRSKKTCNCITSYLNIEGLVNYCDHPCFVNIQIVFYFI